MYKTDNSEGWYLAAMDSAPDEAKKYCEEQKNKGLWHDYQCFLDGTNDSPPKNPHKIYDAYPHIIWASMLHLCTDLIYNRYNGKWYHSDEKMPIPDIKAGLCRDFALDIKPSDLSEIGFGLHDKDDFECPDAAVRILPYEDKYEINIIMDCLDVSGFIKKLKKYGYSNLIVEEYAACKFLAWKSGKNILLILQSYDEYEVEDFLKILVPEQVFYSEFIKLDENKQYISARMKKLYAEFKAEQFFLHTLRWEFDINNPGSPQEYTMPEWNQDCKKKLGLFMKKIKKSTSYNNAFTLGRYEYWLDLKNGRICRKYFRNSQDLAGFIASAKFKHRPGMRLKDVKKQMLDCGANRITEVCHEDKKILFFANGDVLLKETDTHVPELEEFVRRAVCELGISMLTYDTLDYITDEKYNDEYERILSNICKD